MASIKIGKWYTPSRFSKLVDKQKADALVLRGYVLQTDVLTSMVRVIPWAQASGRREKPFEQGRDPGEMDSPVEIVSGRTWKMSAPAPTPIVKRKPGDRVDSLAARMMLEIQKAGKLPGQDDPRIRQIVGEAWKAGRPEITGEVVQTLAARMLQKSENEKKRRDHKRVTTTPN